MNAGGRWPGVARALLAGAFLIIACVTTAAQGVTVHVDGGALQVRAPGFHFISGTSLERLKDGQSIRFDLVLDIRDRAGVSAAPPHRQRFVLSYDLWEERFAVSHTGAGARSVSHLSASGAEAWCLERLTVPLAALGRVGRDTPFWLRLEYVLHDERKSATDGGDSGYSLQGLIERLSRRRAPDDPTVAIEAGPFRLLN